MRFYQVFFLHFIFSIKLLFLKSIENVEASEDFYRCNRSNTCYGGVYQGEYTVTEVKHIISNLR